METTVELGSPHVAWIIMPIIMMGIAAVWLIASILRYRNRGTGNSSSGTGSIFIATLFAIMPLAVLGMMNEDRGPSTESVVAQISAEYNLTDVTAYGSEIFPCSEHRDAAEQKYSWVNDDGEKVFGTLYSDKAVGETCQYALVPESA